ncbi:MAG: hypothetical protein AVDCRST_MAG93-6146 [uncultured Chloroflexia bacterium]|uniref:Uncharacterized protein n=1 Tax=uncultured Chloroflexia bacterium TaxID=1672391 RepID=A0A6J4LEY9_9CHLR|nr:MAG: hypothetical protein AVDCRST_MAG93-6146 [uncultured Chloroflexia bacterium]
MPYHEDFLPAFSVYTVRWFNCTVRCCMDFANAHQYYSALKARG